MVSELEFDPVLGLLREKSVDRLLMADVFDVNAFADFLTYLDSKASKLKDEFAISKQVLSCLRDATKAILSRAEYVPELKQNIEMAYKFELLLDLMIMGETLSERVSGRPRVI